MIPDRVGTPGQRTVVAGRQYCVTNTPATSCAFAWKKLPASNDAWPNWAMKMPPENPPTERKPASNGNMIYTGECPERVDDGPSFIVGRGSSGWRLCENTDNQSERRKFFLISAV